MPSFLEDFFRTYFVNPIFLNQGYNPVNTVAYALILVVAAYFIYKILVRMKVKIDRRLGMSVVPYIILGSSSRILVDSGITDTYLLVSPFIYVVIFVVTFAVLLMSRYLEREYKIPYYKIMTGVGVALVIIPISFLRIGNPIALVYVLAFFAPWPIILYFVKWSEANKIVLATQMFDATNTVVALQFFGYSEQHVVPNLFIGFLSPWVFIPLKLVVVTAALVLIDNYSKDKQFNNFLKLVIAILGGATSLRDFLRLISGV